MAKESLFFVLLIVFLCFLRPGIAKPMIVYRCFGELSSSDERSTSESTVQLNYLGRPKQQLGSAHVKFDV